MHRWACVSREQLSSYTDTHVNKPPEGGGTRAHVSLVAARISAPRGISAARRSPITRASSSSAPRNCSIPTWGVTPSWARGFRLLMRVVCRHRRVRACGAVPVCTRIPPDQATRAPSVQKASRSVASSPHAAGTRPDGRSPRTTRGRAGQQNPDPWRASRGLPARHPAARPGRPSAPPRRQPRLRPRRSRR
jgi:hypothetical protein